MSCWGRRIHVPENIRTFFSPAKKPPFMAQPLKAYCQQGWSLPSDRHIFDVPLFLEHQSYFRWCKVHFNHKTLMKLLDTTPSFLLIFAQEKAPQQSQIGVFFVPKTTGVTEIHRGFISPKGHKSPFQPLVLPCPTKPLILSSCVPCHRCLGFLKTKTLGPKWREKEWFFRDWGGYDVCFFFREIYFHSCKST